MDARGGGGGVAWDGFKPQAAEFALSVLTGTVEGSSQLGNNLGTDLLGGHLEA